MNKHVHNWQVAQFIDKELYREVSPPEWINPQILWVCECGEAKYVTYFEQRTRLKELKK